MKSLFFLLYILCANSSLFGQAKDRHEPFVIKGQLTNSSGKRFYIEFKDKNGQTLMDTINLDIDGNFYLKTFKVKQPQKAIITQNNNQLTSIFAAPGYNLNLICDAKDRGSLLKTKKISGRGAQSNQYLIILDSILSSGENNVNFYRLNDSSLLTYVNNQRKLKDSVAHAVFDRSPQKDKYLNYFARIVQLDIKFSELYRLLIHANYNIYDNNKSVAFVRKNFDTTILDNISRDEYLVSEYFTNLIGGEYLKYLLNIDYQKDSALRNKSYYTLEKINNVYKGKVKEYVLQKVILSMIRYAESFKNLNDAKEQFEPYMFTFFNSFYKTLITLKFLEKEKQLLKTQVGKPAPEFTLENNSKESFSLKDFKGKVVYLDLWASWCKPCRAESPFLNTMNAKYKNDNRIVFISIAVADEINKWKKALKEDKPEWIQLIDKDDLVWKSYVLSNSIPRFILIDKLGNIVNFDAPRPSSGNEIEILINQEIIK